MESNYQITDLDVRGTVADIQDFAVHDGPGLRILVFLKGCQLACNWCQNPEDIAPEVNIEYYRSLCLHCFKCKEVCPVEGAIIEDDNLRIDRSKCTKCLSCVDVCMGKALGIVGREMSVKDVVDHVVKYTAFFRRSQNGGVTLSGGDPTFQPQFSLALLRSLRVHGIHTAVETAGCTKYDNLKAIAESSDLIIYDIKHMDDADHILGTGQSNKLILDNLKQLCQDVSTEIAIHIPLIPGFNDSEENVRRTADFVSSLRKGMRVDLLPFNYLASGKYSAIGRNWEYEDVGPQSDEYLARLRDIVSSNGLEVTVGGLW